MAINDNIRKRREELDMSQDELAQKLGYIHRSSINKIENGTNSFPVNKIDAFAVALRTTPEMLMGTEIDKVQEQASYYIVEKLLIENLQSGQNPEYVQFACEYVDRLVKIVYGQQGVQLLNYFEKLNNRGKSTIIERIDELTKLERYTDQYMDINKKGM